ncbi:hypothetical protein [Microvirga pudoricolor]|uniref:hypothetical protein n=1 Tax=Microvirga pudoricolor TaxID=2778729 RepID=UPI001951C11C|nr:hypothetical protein [Microvirga pudoricolor]MBM6595343.1 hypothetical protein [Microvirga pudoricolor]
MNRRFVGLPAVVFGMLCLPAFAQPAPSPGFDRVPMGWFAPGQNAAVESLWSDIHREGLRGFQAARIVTPTGDFLATMAGGPGICEHGETQCQWRVFMNRDGKAVEVARFAGTADAWCAALSKDKTQLDLCGRRLSLLGLAQIAARVQP